MPHRPIALLVSLILCVVCVAGAPVVNAGARMAKRVAPKIPISLPVAQSTDPNGITFANAVDHIADIPQVAWQRVQDVLEANNAVTIPTKIYIGPHTDTTARQILDLLKREYRLWAGFSQPSTYTGLTFSASDERWAEAKFRKLAAKGEFNIIVADYVRVLRSGCEFSGGVAVECGAGNSITLPEETMGFSFYGVQSGGYWTSAQQSVGPMSQVTHEYLHNVQFAQWIGVSSERAAAAHLVMPCWWQEGQANAIGNTVWSPDFSAYEWARNYNVTRPIEVDGPAVSLTSYSAEAFAAFLDQSPSRCYHPGTNGDYQLGYSVGFAAVEALIAISGPQATMAVLARTARGDSWASAFRKVYGITWSAGRAYLGEILAAEYAVMPFR